MQDSESTGGSIGWVLVVLLIVGAIAFYVISTMSSGSDSSSGNNKGASTMSDKNRDVRWFDKLEALLKEPSLDQKQIVEFFEFIGLKVHANRFSHEHSIAQQVIVAAEKQGATRKPVVVGVIVRDGDENKPYDIDIAILKQYEGYAEHPFEDDNVSANVSSTSLDLRSFFVSPLDSADVYRAGIAVPALLARLAALKKPGTSAIIGWDSGDWVKFK